MEYGFQPHQLQHWNKTINYSTEPFVSALADKEGEGGLKN